MVRTVRVKLQMTQEELSIDSGIPQVTIARWETGMQKPRAKLLRKFFAYCESKKVKFN